MDLMVSFRSVLLFALEGLYLLITLVLLLALIIFLSYKAPSVKDEWVMWRLGVPMRNDDIGWFNFLETLWKFRTAHLQEHLLKESGIISYRLVSSDTSLNIYLLKEAFEELERHPWILADPKFYDYATAFMLEPVPRAAFMKIPDDRKFDWLNKRYRDDMLIGGSWNRYFHENIYHENIV